MRLSPRPEYSRRKAHLKRERQLELDLAEERLCADPIGNYTFVDRGDDGICTDYSQDGLYFTFQAITWDGDPRLDLIELVDLEEPDA